MRLDEEILKKEGRPKTLFSLCGFLFSIKNKVNLIRYSSSFFFTSFAASESLSTAVVTTLFAASIKVTYKLGQKEMSIPD